MLLLALAACEGPDDTRAATQPDTRSVVLSSIGFAHRAEDGSTWGFDLDHHVSDADDDEGCRHADLVDPDGLPGIDSAFSALVPVLESSEAGAVGELVQDSVRNGQLLLMVELSGVDDALNDDCVDVRILRGTGTPLIGTDGELLDGQTFALATGPQPEPMTCVPLVDGSVRAGPVALPLEMNVLDVSLALGMTDAWLRLDLSEDGRTGWGYFGGAVLASDILVIVDQGDLEEFADVITGLVNASADLQPNDADTCDALSIVLEFGAIEAFVYEG